MKLCNSCTKIKNQIKSMGLKKNSINVMCFDLHCSNVYDPFDSLKKQHEKCIDDENCISNQPERLSEKTQ